MYSRVLVDQEVKNAIPSPLSLERLRGRNGLASGPVVILDSRTILIPNLTFKGLAPDTHFMVGRAGTIPNDIDGNAIPDEKGNDDPLGSYSNDTVILSVPLDQPDLSSAKWFSIWSAGIRRSLADILLPMKTSQPVPPALDAIGVEPKVRPYLSHHIAISADLTII